MELVSVLKEYLVPKTTKIVDNYIFKLQYIALKWFLIICAALSTSQYFGDWIACLADKKIVEAVNTYCFFSGTFSLKTGANIGSHKDESDILYHKYYQWVPYFLYFQVVMFLFSEQLWKYYENNTMERLLMNLRFTELTVEDTDKEEKKLSKDKRQGLEFSQMRIRGFKDEQEKGPTEKNYGEQKEVSIDEDVIEINEKNNGGKTKVMSRVKEWENEVERENFEKQKDVSRHKELNKLPRKINGEENKVMSIVKEWEKEVERKTMDAQKDVSSNKEENEVTRKYKGEEKVLSKVKKREKEVERKNFEEQKDVFKDEQLNEVTKKNDKEERKHIPNEEIKRIKVTIDGYEIDGHRSRQVKVASLAKLLKCRLLQHSNDQWTLKLIFCEVINFLNVSFQIYLTNLFLDKRFLTLGFHSIIELKKAFPTTSKCLFYSYGPSGSIQSLDSLCILTMNLLNDKIFFILWYAYFTVAILTFGNLLWRVIQYCLYRYHWFTRYISGPPVHFLDVGWICALSYTDWLFLKYFSKNTSPAVFQTIIAHVLMCGKLPILSNVDEESGNDEDEAETCISYISEAML